MVLKEIRVTNTSEDAQAMGKIGYGYGSEWHLLRYLGYHRKAFDEAVCGATGADSVEWLDFPCVPGRRFPEEEWQGLDFLPEDHLARREWLHFWPQTGNVQNWDAVGVVRVGGASEWLLVEAKAHLDEVRSSCRAAEKGGLLMIRAALEETKAAVGADESRDWLSPYYQYANRLAALYFLTKHDVPARVLFVYFVGDIHQNHVCPRTSDEWERPLREMYDHLGLHMASQIEQRVHTLILPVCPG